MTDPSRGVRVRRVNRRPGWVLLTALLVLAIVASTVLVFTNRVELLKLAVVLALWAAVAAAFVSFIYRRQSDLDQAKVRDLKYVYDLQLDREISARREYELAVEAQLRRELSAELRAQAADEVAALRAELAALRTNLEILFDTDLDHRPALETERPAGRVIASRVDTPVRAEFLPPPRSAREPRTEESPIIDVPAEPHPPEYQWAPAEPVRPEPVAPELFGGAHRRASDTEEPAPWQRRAATSQPPPPPPSPAAPPIPEPAAAQWSPPPPATWEPPPAPEPAPRAEQPSPETPERRGRHYGSDAESTPPPRRSRHAVPGETGPPPPPRTRRAAQPDREPPAPPVPSPTPPPVPSPTPPPAARHRSAEELQRAAEQPEPEGGQHAGGQPVSELLSRLQAAPTGGGRRRRREE